MGIEPFLLIGIVVVMFVVQAARAWFDGVRDRLEFSDATLLGVQALTARRRMLPDPRAGGWRSDRDDITVQVWFDSYPALQIRSVLAQQTGVHPPLLPSTLGWLAPSILVVVRLNEPLTTSMCISRALRKGAAGPRLRPHNPIVGHLATVRGRPEAAIHELLERPRLQEPLMQLLGEHPLSVVTEDVVALWCTRAVDDPEPLIDLAVRVATALQDVPEPVNAIDTA